jgi:hypothetical protein
MALEYVNPEHSPSLDSSTAYTSKTPAESVVDDLPADPLNDAKESSSSVPWPGSTFIIRSAKSGDVLTLLDGQVILARPGGRGSIHWACVETKGWLGFKNLVTGCFLGHDKEGKLCCLVKRHQPWESFCVRMRPEGGYVLLMTHWERLWHVGSEVEQGVEKLAKVGDGGSGGIVWEFVKV